MCNREHSDERKRWSAQSMTAMYIAREHTMACQTFLTGRIKKGIGIKQWHSAYCQTYFHATASMQHQHSGHFHGHASLCLNYECSHQLANHPFNIFFKLLIKLSRTDGCLCLCIWMQRPEQNSKTQISGWNSLVLKHTFHSVLICLRAPKVLHPKSLASNPEMWITAPATFVINNISSVQCS